MSRVFTEPSNLVDGLIITLDRGLRSVIGQGGKRRENPAHQIHESTLTTSERRLASGLMRVDHAGEIAAQALYHGQALTAGSEQVRRHLERAAAEENDHLYWCRERLVELSSRTSYLDPLWYAGSFVIGAAAGLAGDKWSLGFVAETERQVVAHLDSHLSRLPGGDRKSRAILEQMRVDEGTHATTALQAGAAELPRGVKKLMRWTARIMTRTAYWV